MKFLVWDSESDELENFFDTAESFANLDIFEDLDDLIDEVIEGDVVVFDLDAKTKEVEKAVKQIKKGKFEFVLIYLTNKMDKKKIAKHQKGKLGGQLYIKTPIEDAVFANMLQPFVDEKIQIGLSQEDQNKLLKGHVGNSELSEEVQALSDKFDSIFGEVFGEGNQAKALAEVDEPTDHSIQASDAAPLDVGLDEGDDALSIADDDGAEDLLVADDDGAEDLLVADDDGAEDLLVADDDGAEDLLVADDDGADALSIADDDGAEDLLVADDDSAEESLSLSEDDNEETILPDDDDLAFPDMDDLAYPDMGASDSTQSETPVDDGANEELLMADDNDNDLSLDDDTATQESGAGELDLSADDGGTEELSLGGDELVSEVDVEEGALDLSGGDDSELSLSDDEAANEVIDTSEDGALDLSVDDGGDSLDLSADGDDGGESLDLSEDGALDLSGDTAIDEAPVEAAPVEEAAPELPETPADDDMGLEFGSDEAGNDLDDLDFGSGDPEPAAEPVAEPEADALQAGASDDELFGDSAALDDDLLGDDLLGEDLGDGISDDDLFGDTAALDDEIAALDDMSLDDAGLTSDQLPSTPDLGGEEDLSTNAKVQLAEIDAMMSDSDVVVTSIESTEAFGGEQFEKTEQTDGLAKELNAMSPEFDATTDDKTDIMNASEITKPIEAPYKTATNISANQLNEHKEVMAHSSEELVRLGETIKNLREDREKLLEKVYHFEEEKNKEKQDFINLQAEVDERKIELNLTRKRYEKQIEDYRYQLDISQQKKQILEEKNKQLEKDVERLSKKSNVDMTRIRARETELENKLDLLRADSEMQIKNRDQKILELKRRIDTLEFDVESMHMKERKVVDNNTELEDKMDRVIRTLRHAIGELEDNDNSIHHLEKVKKNLDI